MCFLRQLLIPLLHNFPLMYYIEPDRFALQASTILGGPVEDIIYKYLVPKLENIYQLFRKSFRKRCHHFMSILLQQNSPSKFLNELFCL